MRNAPTPADLIARARALAPTLAARALDGERERRLPKDTIADMQAAGFFHVLRPKRWDGFELEPSDFFEIQMTLAEGDFSTAWIYGVVGLHPWLMGLLDDRAAQDVWGKDASALICSSLMPVGKAALTSSGYRFTGHWQYSSGSDHCAWAFLGGTFTNTQGGPPERALFLVPRSDFEIVDTWHVAGLKATGSNDIVVKDAFVPAHRTIKLDDTFRCTGPGQAVNTGTLYRYPFGQIFFRGVSVGAIGALQGMLNAFIEFSRTRISRYGKPSDDPIVQLLCAEIVVAVDEMKAVLHHNMRVIGSFAERGEQPPMSDRIRYKFQSAAVVERCRDLAARLFMATSGQGLYTDKPFGRILADINAARQHLSNQFEALGRNFGGTLFGLEDNKDQII